MRLLIDKRHGCRKMNLNPEGFLAQNFANRTGSRSAKITPKDLERFAQGRSHFPSQFEACRTQVFDFLSANGQNFYASYGTVCDYERDCHSYILKGYQWQHDRAEIVGYRRWSLRNGMKSSWYDSSLETKT